MEKRWRGLIEYHRASDLQRESHARVARTLIPEILGLEHPTTITLGHRAQFEKELNFAASHFESENIGIVKTDRGGMATLHSPGQLVIYPIIPLRKFDLRVRDFLCVIEKTTKETLEKFGIVAQGDLNSPGLYTSKGKIAFYGFRIDRGISRHGISINVSNDLSLFQNIKSCGVQSPKLDRTQFYSTSNTQDIFNIWAEKLIHNLATKSLDRQNTCV